MKINVLLTAELFVRFTLFDILKRRKMWKSPAIFAGILSPCALVCYLMNHVDGAVMLGTVLLIVGLGMPIFYFADFFLSLRKQVIAQGLKRPQNVYNLELTKEKKGIHISNGKESADYAWKDVYHVYRDTICTYLYMTPARAFLLPHTCLGDHEPDELWALITSQIPAEKTTVL